MNEGNLRKMVTALNDGKVQYQLSLGDQLISLNPLVGSKISLKFDGEIHCVHCGDLTKKSYSDGYCGRCIKTLAQCDLCIVRPELCHYGDGTCREPEWGEKNCLIPHYVYLANSSGVKVGITRHTQIPTRWIDQGAIQAIPIFKVSTRLQSGQFEKLLSQEVSDKTNWRKMLKNEVEPVDLEQRRDELFEICGDALDELEDSFESGQIEFLENEAVTELEFPVLEYPEKITSLNFEKNPHIEATLQGIKGQYLITDKGVLNLRRHSGYKIQFQ